MPEHIKRCPRRLRGLGGLVGRSVGLSIDLLSSLTRDRGDTCSGKTEAEEAEKQQVEDTQAEGGGGGGLLEEGETAIDGRRLEEIGLEDLAVDEQCS